MLMTQVRFLSFSTTWNFSFQWLIKRIESFLLLSIITIFSKDSKLFWKEHIVTVLEKHYFCFIIISISSLNNLGLLYRCSLWVNFFSGSFFIGLSMLELYSIICCTLELINPHNICQKIQRIFHVIKGLNYVKDIKN